MFGDQIVNDGKMSYCQVQVYVAKSPMLPGIHKLAPSRVSAMLGKDHTTTGGPMVGTGLKNFHITTFARPGFPPPAMVRVQQYDRVINLNLTLFAPRKEK